ncbi:MAG: efflux RND transporter periplasmic adaptor subunit [bacterium]|nr:efflux RND transporter periplasmic adaptor subunit [bacterium]
MQVVGVLKRFLIPVLIAGMLLYGGQWALGQLLPPPPGQGAPVYATAEVVRGVMRVAVEGVGNLQPIFLSSLEAPVEGFVETVLIERGQRVEPGQVVMTLKSDEIGYEVADLQFKIERMRLELAQLLGVAPTRTTEVDPSLGIGITAPIGGRVSELLVGRGDAVGQGSAVARIVDDSRVVIVAELVTYEIERVAVDQEVEIRSPLFDGSMRGKVTLVDRTPIPSGTHFVYRAQVEADNPGLLQPGMEVFLTFATAQGRLSVPREQRIDRYWQEALVRSLAQGTVDHTAVKEWARVKAGDTLLTLGGEATTQFIQGRQLDIRQKELELARKQGVREQLVVRSPIAGVVEWVHVRPGTKVMPGWGLAAIFDQSRMNLHIMVDELDVVHLQEGQIARIAVDALPGRSWEAKVLRVDMQGRSQDGIAQYGVSLEVGETAELKPGMTAHVSIHIAEKPDALLVPIEAVFEQDRRAMVEVLGPRGPEAVAIVLGLVNDRFAEVLEGLEAGQHVVTGSSLDRLDRDGRDGGAPPQQEPIPVFPKTGG